MCKSHRDANAELFLSFVASKTRPGTTELVQRRIRLDMAAEPRITPESLDIPVDAFCTHSRSPDLGLSAL